jgi:hypothetical protein
MRMLGSTGRFSIHDMMGRWNGLRSTVGGMPGRGEWRTQMWLSIATMWLRNPANDVGLYTAHYAVDNMRAMASRTWWFYYIEAH